MVYRSFLLFLCNSSLQFLLILHLTRTAAFSEFTNDLFVKKSTFSLHSTLLSITYTLKLLFPWTFIAVSTLTFILYPHIFILCLLHWLFFFIHFSVDIVSNSPALFSLFTLEVLFIFMASITFVLMKAKARSSSNIQFHISY